MQRSLFFVTSLFCLLLIFSSAASLHAEDGTVELKPLSVTTTRTASPLDEIPSSISIISAEEIKLKQKTDVGELLSTNR